MGAEEQIRPRADGGAQLPHEALAELQRLERELAAIEGGVRTRGVELECREALSEILDGALGGEIRVLVDIGLVPGTCIDISVGAQPLVHPPAEELVYRLPGLLADDVPAGHLQRRQDRHQREVRMLGITRGIDTPPERLDVVRVLLAEVALEGVLEHARHHPRMERQAIGLSHPVHIVIGGELDEDEVPPADTGLRVAGDEGADVGQFHGAAI
jgi:hypothetical protein